VPVALVCAHNKQTKSALESIFKFEGAPAINRCEESVRVLLANRAAAARKPTIMEWARSLDASMNAVNASLGRRPVDAAPQEGGGGGRGPGWSSDSRTAVDAGAAGMHSELAAIRGDIARESAALDALVASTAVHSTALARLHADVAALQDAAGGRGEAVRAMTSIVASDERSRGELARELADVRSVRVRRAALAGFWVHTLRWRLLFLRRP
jgi:hypothetical protein